MARRLLVPSAGSGPSNNLIRSLKAGDPSCRIVGCHDDRFVVRKSLADRNYLVPPPHKREFAGALCRIIETEKVDLVIPNSEADVTIISDLRERLPCRTFLPRRAVIRRCQDKYELTAFLRRAGLPVPLTCRVTNLKGIEDLFRRLAPRSPLWCRIRRGSGSMGAIAVKTPGQARSWIKYWQEMRATPAGSFTLSEYLPGRDFCVQGVWKDGKLVLAKMHERLSYYVAGSSPSGVSSTAGLAKMIFEPQLLAVCTNAVRALDAKACGAFFVDLKENAKGRACITEINAGRFANVSAIHDVAGRQNMALTCVRLALGERVTIRRTGKGEEHYVLRDLDTLPAVFRPGELFDGIADAREWGNA
jgi:carbamoyl-phosphate synthase large subunit